MSFATVPGLMKAGLLLLACWLPASIGLSIDHFGADADDNSFRAAQANSRAIQRAFLAANRLPTFADRTVEVPAGSTYYILNSTMSELHDVTLQLDGTLMLFNRLEAWPVDGTRGWYALEFTNCSGVTVTGNGGGLIDGQGWDFWVATLLGRSHSKRPTLLSMDYCQNVLIEHINLRNGPRFHLYLKAMTSVEIHDIDISVDWRRQRDLLAEHGLLSDQGLPMFPFNTDGIDPSGEHIYIHDVTIENWDDAVAVKPANSKAGYGPCCAQHMLVEDITVRYGVGMSIGSVSPNDYHNCINNITFRNVEFTYPMKAIYIKPNPGSTGDAVISNIRYENLMIRDPVWYGIYVGPQQMREPDGGGTGCMLYPLGGDDYCPTDPLVTISNVTLVNVTQTGGVFPPLMRCNETNPCAGFEFVDVRINDRPAHEGWICENVHGTETGKTSPSTGCLTRV